MLKIFCQHCKKHIYNILREPLSGDIIDAANFVPATKEIKQPQPNDLLICPYCGVYFMKEEGDFDGILLTDKGYLPK